MTVTDAGALQGRYARLSDRFKAIWTAHQFVSGAFAQLLFRDLPYELDLGSIYDRIKVAGRLLHGSYPMEASGALDHIAELLDDATARLLEADAELAPSLLRRFFDRLKHHDDSIVTCLIRFYLYADAVEGDRRDKLDLLFTRLGEDFHEERGEFVVRQSLELRERVIELVSLLRVAAAPRDEVVRVIRAIGSLREDIASASAFDELGERNLLRDARTFKHRVGDLYFDPDVLLAIIELNVASKNHCLRLYDGEEERLVSDADKLLAHGSAIARNFGGANPGLADEIARFRLLRDQFDALRAESNVKYDVVTRLKASMNAILAQLDRGLDPEIETAELPASFFDEARVTARFGRSEPLLDYVLRIDNAIESEDPAATAELRLEPWEASSYLKLIERMPADAEEDGEELWLLYLRAAALRMKIDEEATRIASAVAAGVRPEAELLANAKKSLDLAKQLDEQFGDLLQEAAYYTNRRILHQLYRSRFRLLRGFSGLWLIYDTQLDVSSPAG
ncbi:MAG TPA: hypothetical protein VEK11_02045 [Thermoanaerobaculia bacterium]|nr:hypothetical protein [Thermoanaerobaculia bacterium]